MVMFSGRGENNQDVSAGNIAGDALWHGTMSNYCHSALGRLMRHGGASGPSGVVGMRFVQTKGLT